MAISFEQVLAEKRQVVWREIERYLTQQKDFPPYCQIPKRYAPLADFHYQLVSEYPARKGKYIRPTLVLLTASTMGFPEEKALLTAAAMQVSEDWILNHDDIEDNSLQRRGKPTLHRIYGRELAINAGDSLHVLMWKILKDNLRVVGKKKGLQIIEEFYWMLNRTTLGQTVEIKWTQEGKAELTDEDILFILESKTGYYTIAGPMRLGAILAGASETQLDKIYQFGRVLGQCFQIVDDLLDLTSDFKGLKKQKGNDIYEGKRTIMLMHLFRNTENTEKQKLVGIMNKKREEKTEGEVEWVIKLMEKHGTLEYGKKLAERLAKKAIMIFEKDLKFLNHQPAMDQIKAGINFILKRDY